MYLDLSTTSNKTLVPSLSSDKPTAAKPALDKPAADKPAADKPALDKPALDKPAAAEALVDQNKEHGKLSHTDLKSCRQLRRPRMLCEENNLKFDFTQKYRLI